ncbi:receptor-like protein EIX2 [Juglans regia]|uniref:Receptor-like protein EIX2 n=1 Tax=Juglans regia TaxID=51240 RepID=A0A6P9EJ08_JUGRE|nr:receptor-like protein EIX2 [Juglans regia]
MICEHNDRMRGLAFLDLSRNLLSGELPDCWMNYSTLKVLHLGNNSLTGNIPSSLGFVSTLQSLSLYKNNMLGDLPMSLQNCTSLRLLDLTENHFSGSLPTWLGNSYYDLVVLMLRSNKFSGSIPQELCHLTSLQILDLARNNFSGHIPRCFGNFSAMARQDDSSGVFDFLLPLKTLTETAVLVTKGREYKYYSQTLALVKSMDLSSNNLIEEIPKGVTSLYSLRFLNLSANKLNRGIPDNINAMRLLESLDLSWNQLTGAIPQSLASLTSLSHLNLSYNNFSGRIPSGTQIQTFSALSFIGNHDLCGPPLTVSCIGDDQPPEPTPNADNEGGEDDGWIDMKWFYISIPLGFVVGFWGIVGPLAFSKVWRLAYFRFLDDMMYRLFWRSLRA